MAFCVCKCFNVRIRSESPLQNVDINSFGLSTVEQRDAFFNEDVGWCRSSEVSVEVMQTPLVLKRVIGSFTVHTCLVCDSATHAEPNNTDNSVFLINRSLKTTSECFEEFRNSDKYSIYQILVPESMSETNAKSNSDITSETSDGSLSQSQQAMGHLYQQFTRTLRSEMEAVEEAVRIFKNQKYAEFEKFRVKAQKDHETLAKIVKNSSSLLDNTNDNMAPSEPKFPLLERRRLSSFKQAKKPKHNGTKNISNFRTQQDSLDSEGIFDLEGHLEDIPHNGFSDDSDSDTDDTDSNDEGIHIVRGRVDSWAAPMAKSLPMNMPKFINQRHNIPVDRDDQSEPQDIAASIKALARSVHGDVFGELPRPRFSTQI